MSLEKKSLELYIHIPFCVKKCAYCDFLSAPADENTKEIYVKKLMEEIKSKAENCRNYQVISIFYGGGTPSILRAGLIADIQNMIVSHFDIAKDAEITVECNPGTLSFEKLSIYKTAGINRISLGLQSTEDSELKELGRIHTFRDFLNSFDLVRKAGFRNVNIDIMSALPGQTRESYRRTLKRILNLRPEHISAYSLIIEEGTPFYEKYEADELLREKGDTPILLPSEELERAMYEDTKEILLAHGYERYEISNYARPGYGCEHNIGYWKRRDYLGLGLGSSSLMNNVRFHNTTDLSNYLKGDFAPLEEDKLSKEQQMEEFMFLGLRLIKGVSSYDFMENFGFSLEAVYGQVIKKMRGEGLLLEEHGYVYLTSKGLDVSNYVMSQFLFS